MTDQRAERLEDPTPTTKRTQLNSGGPGGTGPATAIPGGFRRGMRAFGHRDFRVFFWGAMVSNTGSWLQNLAVPFALFELTGQALWVGLAGFAQFIPSFLLGPLGGSLADRLDRRKVLMATQSAQAIAALVLWAVWAAGWHEPILILAITAVTGVFSGLMIPSWQAFVPALVPREDLASAITLNSTQFNAARAIGPALAGLILAISGPGLAFLLNGVSYLAVIVAISLIRPKFAEPAKTVTSSVKDGFKDAIAYITRRSGIGVGVLCAVLVAFFGNPVTQFTVVFARDVYNAGPRVLGALAAGVGLGAILAAPALSIWSDRIPRSQLVRWSLPLYAAAVIAFGLAPNWPLGLVALLVLGGTFLVVVSTTNTAVQMIVADHMRGRVMSVRIMGFTLAFPLGSLIQGALSDVWGPQLTVALFGSVLLAIAIVLAWHPTLLGRLDVEDDTPNR
jgi:MFS family permease